MALQMSLLTKFLVAKTTIKRPYVLVHSHMYYQVPRFGEGFAADLAVFENPITIGRLITYVHSISLWDEENSYVFVPP